VAKVKAAGVDRALLLRRPGNVPTAARPGRRAGAGLVHRWKGRRDVGRFVAILAALLLPVAASVAKTPERVARIGLRPSGERSIQVGCDPRFFRSSRLSPLYAPIHPQKMTTPTNRKSERAMYSMLLCRHDVLASFPTSESVASGRVQDLSRLNEVE
jgi:hypothetical protein